MSDPRRPDGSSVGDEAAMTPLASMDPVLGLLERYVTSTAVRPRPELAERIVLRLQEEPPSTAPRRFLAAIAALDPSAATRAFRQCVATGFGPGARPVVARAQALGLVLVVVLGLAVGSLASLAGASVLVSELNQRPTDDQVRPMPQPSESPSVSTDPAVTSTPRPTEPGPVRDSPRPQAQRSTKPVEDGSEPRRTQAPDEDRAADERRETPEPEDASGSGHDESKDREGREPETEGSE